MQSPPRRQYLLAIGASVATAGCLGRLLGDDLELATPENVPPDDWEQPDWEPPREAPVEGDVSATTVVSDLEIPWDLAFAGDDAFVTERDGGVTRFATDALSGEADLTPADGETVLDGDDLPDRAAPGEGGTLGVAVHPDYPDPADLFVYYTAETGDLSNHVVRYDRDGDDLEPIVEGIPGASIHNGGRIAFGPEGDLWVLTGDAEDPAATQDPGSLAGAVLRTTPDGESVAATPDWGADGDSRTYTLGHRNPQGIDFTPEGTPIVAEHGPQARDEISVLRPGGNYGWDVVRGGPDDPEYGNYDEYDAASPPIVNTGETTWAPSGLSFYADDAIGNWQYRLFAAGLGSNALYAVSLFADDPPAIESGVTFDASWLDDRFTAIAHSLFDGTYGRLRHVEPGPDGSLFLLTSNRDGRASGAFPRPGDDRIVRLEPA
ncbi:PQQ-dependent sugar dehydrogenase [Halosolutus amylolyticus]|uniref:PQQ-dependent sugar dehydrogenase n=1 Tax=Halosolutus amylolyticus TaxID=2932267 RepID=A0ABD5PNW5_9EURY|nr:PQQ-dependent sugar dehydrogenase [Halosolutus amylolyticus]